MSTRGGVQVEGSASSGSHLCKQQRKQDPVKDVSILHSNVLKTVTNHGTPELQQGGLANHGSSGPVWTCLCHIHNSLEHKIHVVLQEVAGNLDPVI